MGKLGSIFVQVVLKESIFPSDPAYLGNILGAFAALMALGGFFAWAWLPNVQREPEGASRAMTWPTLPSKELETLAKGRAYAIADPALGGEGQILSLRLKLRALFEKLVATVQKRTVVDSDHELSDHNHRVVDA